MTRHFENLGVRFRYPTNWKVTEEQDDQNPRSVTLQSPGTAYWSLHVYWPAADPGQLTVEALEAMQGEYEGLEFEPLCREVGAYRAEGYHMDFYCFDFLVSSEVLALTVGERTYLFICQAEDREFRNMEPVFRALMTSVLQEEAPTG